MAKPPLRERLLGLLVILCIALIFYPLVFTSENQFRIDRTSQIPQRPALDLSADTIRPMAPDSVESVASPLFVPAEDQLAGAQSDDGILNEQGLPRAELVQAGSFASVDNANDLVDRLIEAGFKAYSRLSPSTGEAPDLHKVYVGPYLTTEQASQAEALLREQMGLEPIRLRFEP